MTTNFEDVGAFHKKFGLTNLPADGYGPKYVTNDLLEFRTKFMQEELDEFIEGVNEGDDAKMFDALLDLTYVAMGTAHMLGYPWESGWTRVQRANMEKVRGKEDGSDSKRGSRWDVVKPAGWKAPDIEGLLRLFGFKPKTSDD